MLFAFTGITTGQVTTTTTKTTRTIPKANYWTITPQGGVLFPVGSFGEGLNAGASFGLDFGYRINKEVGVWLKGGYSMLNAKENNDIVPKTNIVDITAGLRYFFTKPGLKSAIMAEVGFGPYMFNRDQYTLSGVVIPELSETKIGINGGLGANLALSKSIDFMIKVKYHNVFTDGGSSSFITTMGGIEFKLQ